MSVTLQEEYARRRREAKIRGEQERHRVHQLYPELGTLQQEMAQLQARQLLATLQQDWETLSACRLERQERERTWKAFFASHPEISPDYGDPKPFCPICQDEGTVQGQPCRCQLEWVVSQSQLESEERLIARSSFDRILEAVYPNTEEGQKAQEKRSLAIETLRAIPQRLASRNLPQNLYLSGIQGSGKTFLAGCLAHAVREQGIPCLFLSSRRYFAWLEEERLLRARYQPDADRLQTLQMQLKLVETVQVLILDDLGSESDVIEMQVLLPRLTQLLDTRIPPQTCTIFTSSVPFSLLHARYDERVQDRMQRLFWPMELPTLKPDFSPRGGKL